MAQFKKKSKAPRRKGLLHDLAETKHSETINYANESICKTIGKNAITHPNVKPDIVKDIGDMFNYTISFAKRRVSQSIEDQNTSNVNRYKKQVGEMTRCKEIAMDTAKSILQNPKDK